MVSGVNLTFEDASNSAASESEIQSEGGFDIGQSGAWPVDSGFGAGTVAVADDSDVGDDSAEEESLAPPATLSDSFVVARADLVASDRSLRAQPLPLKWTAAAVMAFFIGPPHSVHVVGPCPWTECMTSIPWPQVEQT
jgi:hypothetical protein